MTLLVVEYLRHSPPNRVPRCRNSCAYVPYLTRSPLYTASQMSSLSSEQCKFNLSQLPSRKNRQWVSTSTVHNAFSQNHLLDMLELHGTPHHFSRDDHTPHWRQYASFAFRMRSLGAEFRRQVTGAFARRIRFENVLCVSSAALSTEEQSECTTNAMACGVKMIAGAVLTDARSCVYARVPILLRADVADQIFQLGLAPQCELECYTPSHSYVAVAIKRRTVDTKGSAVIKNACLEKLQKEMFLWNLLLSQSQSFRAPTALIIGLHPKRKKAVATGAFPFKAAAATGGAPSGALFDRKVWKLALLPFDNMHERAKQSALEALRWRIEVVDDGNAWLMDAAKRMSAADQQSGQPLQPVNPMYALLRTTSDPRLRPNMKSATVFDWPWEQAKRQLAHDLRELTLVSGISRSAVEQAMAKGIPNDYSHHQVTAEALDSNSLFTRETLRKNKPDYKGPPVTPKIIPHNRANWRLLKDFRQQYPHQFSKNGHMLPHVEQRSFYVDLELASAEYLYANHTNTHKPDADPHLMQKFGEAFDVYPTSPLVTDTIPDSLVFMIGCGRFVEGAWNHNVFIAETLNKQGEQQVISEWLQHMNTLTCNLKQPALVHVWGPEKQLLKQAFRRMPQAVVDELRPLLNYVIVDVHKIVSTSCVSIRGSLNNSIKSVASALENLGLLDDSDTRGKKVTVENGAEAMAAALHATELVHKNEVSSLSEVELVQNVARYNEHDCRDVARIVAYLRNNH
eukprot:TRINITY_DN421_c0_g6_i1.p1 TRINITY_DN421_c0_g6~~TRINITY_DN421_c0_g6_i1.p1  ORF type:complete len:739 (-),score=109.72 TRINITY_DN421_c0_g6_i1:65-2281(-)